MMNRSHIIIDIIWMVRAKMSLNLHIMKYSFKSNKQRRYGGKRIVIIFSCKKWTYMKFSEDYVDLVENIIILITVALWEICWFQGAEEGPGRAVDARRQRGQVG